MHYFTAYTEWLNWADTMFASAESEEATLASMVDVKEAQAMASSMEKQVAQQKAFASRDEAVRTARSVWRDAKAKRKAIGIQVNALERNLNIISRELSRRIGREPNQRRQQRFAGA